MKKILIPLDDREYEALKERKGKMTWKEFLMSGVELDENEAERMMSMARECCLKFEKDLIQITLDTEFQELLHKFRRVILNLVHLDKPRRKEWLLKYNEAMDKLPLIRL